MQELTQQEFEQALKVVNRAWLEEQGYEVELRVPKTLHHLTMQDWEEISRILIELLYQQQNSPMQ